MERAYDAEHRTGTPGGPNIHQPATGNAEVHTRLTGGGEASSHGAAGRAREAADTVRERADDAMGEARGRAQQVRDRAGETASRAQHRAGEMLDRAEDRLEDTGFLSTVRQNPLPALGIAFGAGFLLAGGGDGGSRGALMTGARKQLRSAVMSGISAVLAQELRSFMDGEAGGALGSLLESFQAGGEQSSPRG